MRLRESRKDGRTERGRRAGVVRLGRWVLLELQKWESRSCWLMRRGEEGGKEVYDEGEKVGAGVGEV